MLYSEPLLRRTNVSAKVQLSLATLACSVQAQIGRVGCGVSAQQARYVSLSLCLSLSIYLSLVSLFALRLTLLSPPPV